MALTGLTNLQPLHVHSIGISTFDGSVSVGGTLTYEDVTNVDSIGIITARSGINISDTTQSSSTTTGALKVAGGVGVVKNLQVGGSITGIGSIVVSSNATFTAAAGYSVIANGSSTGIGLGSNGIIVFGSQNIAAYGPGVLDGTQFQFLTSGSERLRIDSAGNMGLGITPDTQGGTVDSLQIGSATNLYNETSDDYTILGNNVYFDGTNNKYIKTQESSRLMQNAGEFTFQQAASGSADANITYTTPLKIDSSGNVMIGTTSSTVYDDSSGSGVVIRGATGAVDIMRDNDICLLLNRNTGDGQMLRLARSGVGKADISLRSNALCLDTGGTERLRISTSGQLGVSHDLTGTSNYNRLMLHNPHDGSCWIQMTSATSGNTANTDGLSIGLNSSNHGHFWLRENAKMMLATNNTSRMEISASGIVTKPYQVAWAMHGVGVQNITGGTKLAFNVNGSGFGSFSNRNHGGVDTTNNSFTAPVTGLYSITLTLFCYTDNNTNTFSIVPFKNGTAMHNGNDTIFILGASAVNANITYSGTVLLQLNANDEIDLRRRPGEAGTSRVYLSHSHFSGFLVG